MLKTVDDYVNFIEELLDHPHPQEAFLITKALDEIKKLVGVDRANEIIDDLDLGCRGYRKFSEFD